MASVPVASCGNSTITVPGIHGKCVLKNWKELLHYPVWERVLMPGGPLVFKTCVCEDAFCENRPSIIHDFSAWFADAKRRALGLPRTFLEVPELPKIQEMIQEMSARVVKNIEDRCAAEFDSPRRFVSGFGSPFLVSPRSFLISTVF